MAHFQIDLLKGVRVLLSAHYLPGPMAAYLLRGMGAEVIKVERPGVGDLMRQLPPFIQGQDGKKMSAYFRAVNAGFKSVALDFKVKQDVNAFKALIQKSDILIDGNRAHYLKKQVLKADVHDINPEIIYLPITAYGLKGPLSERAAHGNNILGLAGNASFMGALDHKMPLAVFGVQLVDMMAAYNAAFAAVCALYGKLNAKSHESIKQFDVSLLHTTFFLNQIYLAQLNTQQENRALDSALLDQGLPYYRAYQTQDNRFVFLGAIEEKIFYKFCEHLKCTELAVLFKQKAFAALEKALTGLFLSKPFNAWCELAKQLDCISPINTLKEATQEEQIQVLDLTSYVNDPHYGSILLGDYPMGFSKDSLMPGVCHEKAPELGEHTDEVLSNLLDEE